jgi:hypothetical protein
MKRFKNIREMAQPKSPEEKRFKDQHSVEVLDPEGHGDDIKPKTQKKKRLADYMDGQDKAAYDKAYTVKKEAVEEDALSEDTLAEDIADIIVETYRESILEMSEEELDAIVDRIHEDLEG